jgi:NAD(P)H dehydrogenase (quinone)
MQVHLIHANSEQDSFVAAMRDVIIDRFQARGATVSLSDLYAKSFNPVLSPADFRSRRDPGHLVYAREQRHSFETGTLAPDILEEIALVQAADILVFTFPLYWFSVPAILKGWIDRVFISGLFYGGKRVYGRGGMAGKRAFAAFSLGGRADMFGPEGIHGPLETGMLRHFLVGTLGYVGLTVVEPFAAYNVPYISAEARQALLCELSRRIERFNSLPLISVPNLEAFDDRLAPRRA